jgi:hypothetical protein
MAELRIEGGHEQAENQEGQNQDHDQVRLAKATARIWLDRDEIPALRIKVLILHFDAPFPSVIHSWRHHASANVAISARPRMCDVSYYDMVASRIRYVSRHDIFTSQRSDRETCAWPRADHRALGVYDRRFPVAEAARPSSYLRFFLGSLQRASSSAASILCCFNSSRRPSSDRSSGCECFQS